MKSIKLFVVAFFAMFLGAAIGNGAVAQSAGDKVPGDEPSIDEIVVMIDQALVKEKGKMRCVRRDDVVYLEHEVPASEYEDMKSAMENFGWVVKKMIKKTLSRDKNVKESFRMITDKGYRLAYSVKCGENEPVVIEIEL